MDNGTLSLFVKLARQHGVILTEHMKGFAQTIFEAGQKNGVYQAMLAMDDDRASLDDISIDELSHGRADLILLISHKFKSHEKEIEAILKEKLQESMASQMIGLGMIEKAKEALDEAYLGHRVSCRETEILKDMMKELVGDKKP